jgi:hypothetical protein
MKNELIYLASQRWEKVGHQELRSTPCKQEIVSCSIPTLIQQHEISPICLPALPNKLRADIYQALLSQFSLLVEFLIGKLIVKDRGYKVLKLVNLSPDLFNI